ncbi:MAG: nucleotidyltransferase family protein [Pseudomonadota bacterium]
MSNNRVSFPLIPAAEVQVREDLPVLKALQIIESSIAKIALVIDSSNKLLGSITDGDIRRAFLKGCTGQSPVREVMHSSPRTMLSSSTKNQIIEVMLVEKIKQIPLLEADGTLLGIAIYDMLTGFERVPRDNPVVIMAGGKGKRLLPLTADIPKPMIEVGGKPILEKILQHFITQGFSNFYFAVNYLGNVIEDYFADGSKWNCNIKYVREKDFLGTAGALSLLKSEIKKSFIVINGDIITSLDFCDLLDYHDSSKAIATVCARQHLTSVPYGVIKLKDGKLEAIVEKPVYEDLISAGIYAFTPEVLGFITDSTVIDMPDVLLSLAKENQKVDIFPMKEDWVDVGRHDDLEHVKSSFV